MSCRSSFGHGAMDPLSPHACIAFATTVRAQNPSRSGLFGGAHATGCGAADAQ